MEINTHSHTRENSSSPVQSHLGDIQAQIENVLGRNPNLETERFEALTNKFLQECEQIKNDFEHIEQYQRAYEMNDEALEKCYQKLLNIAPSLACIRQEIEKLPQAESIWEHFYETHVYDILVRMGIKKKNVMTTTPSSMKLWYKDYQILSDSSYFGKIRKRKFLKKLSKSQAVYFHAFEKMLLLSEEEIQEMLQCTNQAVFKGFSINHTGLIPEQIDALMKHSQGLRGVYYGDFYIGKNSTSNCSPDTFKKIIESMKHIRIFALENISTLHEEGISIKEFTSCLNRLKELRLYYCDFGTLTSDELADFSSSHPQIRVLGLYFSNLLTTGDEKLKALLSPLHHLEALLLYKDECILNAPEHLKLLIPYLPNLKILGISPEEYEKLKWNLPQILEYFEAKGIKIQPTVFGNIF